MHRHALRESAPGTSGPLAWNGVGFVS
jgi:hypothetical protein